MDKVAKLPASDRAGLGGPLASRRAPLGRKCLLNGVGLSGHAPVMPFFDPASDALRYAVDGALGVG